MTKIPYHDMTILGGSDSRRELADDMAKAAYAHLVKACGPDIATLPAFGSRLQRRLEASVRTVLLDCELEHDLRTE